jgi:hypothetical protein
VTGPTEQDLVLALAASPLPLDGPPPARAVVRAAITEELALGLDHALATVAYATGDVPELAAERHVLAAQAVHRYGGAALFTTGGTP